MKPAFLISTPFPISSINSSQNDTPLSQSKPVEEKQLFVTIVDDEFHDRLTMERVILRSTEFCLSGSHATAEEALVAISLKTPDLVLMDVRLPGISGIECVRHLKVIFPKLIVVMVSGLFDLKTISDAREAGCDGYLTKPFTEQQCLATLRHSSWRREPLRKDMKRHSLARSHAEAQLTDHENQIMECMASGLLYKEVADHLLISYSAVHKSQHKVFLKLQARNRTEAIAKWRSIGRV